MPLWLRKFVYGKVKQHYDKQAEQVKASKQKSNSNTKNIVNPGGLPSKSSYK